MATRKALSVLPLPVGASSRVDSPRVTGGHPFACAPVGAAKEVSNHRRVHRCANASGSAIGP
ncbi:MAG: hypothetical protein M5U28_22400 [Sandaracinaceae bacterium]|nr:hypothetical protein [Sandaracinaceae bacterium]